MAELMRVEVAAVATGFDRTATDVRNLAGNVRASAQTADTEGRKLTRSMSTMAGAVGGVFALAGAELIQSGRRAFEAGVQMEEALVRIPALVGDVGMSVEQMKNQVNDLARETARPAGELAEALFAITSAGFSGADAMAILEQSAKASAAGLGNTRDVSFAVGSAVNAYGSEVLSAADATDILTGTVKAGNLEASSLAGVLGNVLPIASQAKVGLEEVGGAVALLTRNGASAGQAVTQVRSAITALLAPTAEAEKVLRQSGITAEQLKTTLAEDGLVAAMRMVVDAAGGQETVLRKLLGSQEAMNAVLTITSASNETLASTFGAVADSAGLAGEAFATTAESDAFKYRQAMNEVSIAMQDLALDMAPVVSQAGSVAGEFANLVTSLDAGEQRFLMVAGTALAATRAIGPLGGIVAGLAGAWVLWQGAQEDAARELEETRDLLIQFNDVGSTTVRRLQEMVDTLPPVADELDQFAEGLANTATQVLFTEDVIERGLLPTFNALNQAGIDVAAMTDMTGDRIDTLSSVLEDAAERGELLPGILERLTEEEQALAEGIWAAVEAGEVQADNAIKLIDSLVDVKDKLSAVHSENEKQAESLLKSADAYRLLTERGGLAANVAAAYLEELQRQGEETSYIDAARDLVAMLEEQERYFALVTALGGEYGDAIEETAGQQEVFSRAIGLTNEAVQNMIGPLDAWEDAQARVREENKLLADKLKGSSDEAENLRQHILSTDATLNDWTQSLIEQRQAMREFGVNLQILADEGFSALVATLQEMGPEGVGLAAEAVQMWEDGLIDDLDALEAELAFRIAAMELGLDVVGEAQLIEAASMFYTRGVLMGEGLVLGLNSMQSAVELAAIQLGNKAVSGLDWPIEVASPSKRTMRSGVWFGEGFAIGIASTTPQVEAAIGEMIGPMYGMGGDIETAMEGAKAAIERAGIEDSITRIMDAFIDAENDVASTGNALVEAMDEVARAEEEVTRLREEAIRVTREESIAILDAQSSYRDLGDEVLELTALYDAMASSGRDAIDEVSLGSELSMARLERSQFRYQERVRELTKELADLARQGKDTTEVSLDLRLTKAQLEDTTLRLNVAEQTAISHGEDLARTHEELERTTLEHDQAADDLAQTITDSTGPTDDLIQAEKDLADAHRDAEQAEQDHEAAIRDLMVAERDLQIDMLQVMLRIGDLIAKGGEWRGDMGLSGTAMTGLANTTGAQVTSMVLDFGRMATGFHSNALRVTSSAGAITRAINAIPATKNITVTTTNRSITVRGTTNNGTQVSQTTTQRANGTTNRGTVTAPGLNFEFESGTQTLAGRASGGSVWPGVRYLVGEGGPEIFEAAMPGNIIPARETRDIMRGGDGPTMVQAVIELDSEPIARVLVPAIQKHEGVRGRQFTPDENVGIFR